VSPPASPHVVILGGGFAGLYAAKALKSASVKVTVVDRRNHHLFQPMLYQVATAALSPGDIASPIRSILRDQANVEVILGEARSVDTAGRRVLMNGSSINYDYLIVATGARHSYFGHEEWEILAPGLKSIEDALEIRRRILLAFEGAEREPDPNQRKTLLTFVVVGGGPTGVEVAGALAEIRRYALRRDFRHIDSREATVLLLEGGTRLLSSYPESLSRAAARALHRLGVEVRTDAFVDGITRDGVSVGGVRIPTKTVVWAAGNLASPLLRSLGAPVDAQGRVMVGEDCTIPAHPEVFVLGDAACFDHREGGPLPGLSPVAIQMGRHAAKTISRDLRGHARRPFRYRDKGQLAVIGRGRAVADIGRLHFSGFVAWLTWIFVHIFFLIGFRNRIIVLMEWGWSYLTFQHGARLITGEGDHRGLVPPGKST
jgi:NADH dehydrogenase